MRERRSEHQRSYDAAFCSELDRKYICPVCLSALHEPMQTSCGHRFCKSCILGVINERTHAKCPVDNVVFKCNDELFEDKAFQREVLSQTVKCGNHDKGCAWTGELRSYEEHENTCLYISVPCDNSCGISVPRHNLTEHATTCERRPVNCQHCHSLIPFTDLTKHQVLVCQNLPVQCTLCGQTGICRKDISAHIDITTGDCPLTVIPCQYASFGCQFQDKRCDMTDHYREAANNHILLLVRKVSDQEQRITALERSLLEIQQEQEALHHTTSN
ncbi:TNF receptor-associated factor 6-B-like [Saccostrea echinata]|uniref:TNF receptor-associated factor 6-B-like n=1 Tax=Saccostrea echinata TaxID=191078 RepID=UPI002A7F3484|nr:TNF receptor-associated factor 6-B-like [Saccostrea echinata]